MSDQGQNVQVQGTQNQKKSDWLLKTLRIVAAVLIVVVLLKFFVADFYPIEGNSMSPTYHDGDIVLGVKIGKVEQFDAVIVDAKENLDAIGYNDPSVTLLFKRVVAVGGDAVYMQDGWLVVERDGKKTVYENETHDGNILHKMTSNTFGEEDKVVVPEGYVYLLGDNRTNSLDSRQIGVVKTSNIIARV